MVNKKMRIKKGLLVVSFFLIFVVGIIIGGVFEPILNEIQMRKYENNIINFVYEEIEKNFGYVTQYDEEKYEVVGGIGLKDLTFSIIIENGVKTIRAYKYVHENDR